MNAPALIPLGADFPIWMLVLLALIVAGGLALMIFGKRKDNPDDRG